MKTNIYEKIVNVRDRRREQFKSWDNLQSTILNILEATNILSKDEIDDIIESGYNASKYIPDIQRYIELKYKINLKPNEKIEINELEKLFKKNKIIY